MPLYNTYIRFIWLIESRWAKNTVGYICNVKLSYSYSFFFLHLNIYINRICLQQTIWPSSSNVTYVIFRTDFVFYRPNNKSLNTHTFSFVVFPCIDVWCRPTGRRLLWRHEFQWHIKTIVKCCSCYYVPAPGGVRRYKMGSGFRQSVCLSVSCLDLTRERKGIGSPTLAGWNWKPTTQVT